MKIATHCDNSAIGGPHLDQAARDRLDDVGLLRAGHATGCGEAMDAEVVTAS